MHEPLEKRIATFDAAYHRIGEIVVVSPGKCDVCKTSNVTVIAIDSSDGEYGRGHICKNCAVGAFHV